MFNLKQLAIKEGVEESFLTEKVAGNEIIIVRNNRRTIKPLLLGTGLTVKVNANIGTSPVSCDIDKELLKLQVAVDAGADAVMDLSTGGPLGEIRDKIIAASPIAVGTVPIYQAFCEASKRGERTSLTADEIFAVIEEHAASGVDFITVHCGVTLEALTRLRKEGRICGIVSRGGALLAEWMMANNQENPLFAQYDRLLEICRRYRVTLSLGDGLRPGCLADATDRAQLSELIILGELTQQAWEQEVSVMVEGPGHVPINQIEANILLQKRLCHNAPFYVLGPLVTDIAPGYDHITAAIGGALAAFYGADFLCYVTPSEHLSLPNVEDVRTGVITSRIAAHSADVARGSKKAREWDDKMAKCRKNLDWEQQIKLAIDPSVFKDLPQRSDSDSLETCTMCGDFCSMKVKV